MSRFTTPHEVDELDPQTTEQILQFLRTLAPGLTAEWLEGWRKRIEVERQPALVMAIARRVERDRKEGRRIKNPAAWMNSCYLNAMNPKAKESL